MIQDFEVLATSRWSRALLALALCAALPSAAHADRIFPSKPKAADPREGITTGIGIDQNLDAQVSPDLVFRNESGKEVRLGDYMGEKPLILLLVYYECPMLCGVELDGLVRSLKPLDFSIGNEFDILTISFDPKETPALARAKKRNFVKRYGRSEAETGWHFLTGDEESIKALAETVGFRYRWDDERKQYIHAAGLMILTPQGRISRYFYGIDHPPRDLELGLVEASANKIGGLSHKVLLFCYEYDPTTGKYGLAIMRTLQAAGILTVLSMAGGIGLMIVRDRRARQCDDASRPATGETSGGTSDPSLLN